jgi:O-antigen/teichoic acid export membrane protein
VSNLIFYKSLSSRFILLLSHQLSILFSIVILGIKVDEYNFGLISIYLILFQISYLLTEWGYSIYSLHIVNKKKNFLKKIYFEVLFSKFIFLILCIIGIGIFFYFNPVYRINNLSILFLLLSIIFSAFNPLWYLQSISKPEILIKPTIISRFFFLCIIFFLVDQQNLEYFFFGQFISFFLPTVVGNYYIIKYQKPILNFNLKKIFILKKNTVGIFFSTLIQNQTFSLWGGFLIFFSSPLQIAYYSLADQILRAGNGIGNVFQEIFMSIRYKIRANLFFKKILILFIFLFLVTILSIFYVDEVITFIFNKKFSNATVVIRLIIISWFFLTLSKILGYPLLNKFLEIKLLNNISYFVLLFNIFLIFINLFFFDVNAVNASIFFLISIIINLILVTVNRFIYNKI